VRWLSSLRTWWQQYRTSTPLGKRGEQAAARHLKRHGFIIVARGDRGRLGEIDLVAIDQRTVVFVEVKTRTSHDAGHPADAVDRNKQRQLTRAARGYLKRHDLADHSARFDVVAITWSDPRKPPQIEHFRNAFEACD
jgi:putative endonuclease